MRLSFACICILFALSSARRLRRQAIDDSSCTCVPYYLCKDGDVVTGGEGLIDIRTSNDDDAGSEPEVRSCGMFHVCCESPQPEPVVTAPPLTPQCGRRNVEGLATRIVNDGLGSDDTKMGEIPWQAAILRKEGDVNIFAGGASLISARMLLTAAHVVKDSKPSDLKVRLGEYDTQSDAEFYKHADVNVKEIVIHPKYSAGALLNDAAILVLEDPVTLGPNIDTVCLPEQGETFDGLKCTVTGWGKNAFELNGAYQSILKLVDVPIVPRQLCQNQLRETRLGRFFRLHDSFICAGGEEGKDACKGDGGGPLSCSKNGQYKLAGMVAWGIGCGQKDVPGVYVSVPAVMSWVNKVVEERGGL